MRVTLVLPALALALTAVAAPPASGIWTELKAKRAALASLHQEFEVSQTFRTPKSTQASKRQVILDMAGPKWREKSVTGSGTHVRIFDGADTLSLEEDGGEYTRAKRRPKDEEPTPSPYRASDPEWAKAVEVERRPCGLPGRDRQCVLLDVPLKKWNRSTSPTDRTRLVDGTARLFIDTETGLLIALRTVQNIDNGRGGYQSDTAYSLKRLAFGADPDPSLFRLPADDWKEVKELSAWNAARMKKQLAGKLAPDLSLTDLAGQTLQLANLKGRTVLLDFWTTWCPPCRADGPSLDKLHAKYGAKELTIIGISVSEDRALVEKFLKDHPHPDAIALTSENEMPRPYQVGVFPTYIVIDQNGNFSAAVEGDQGFGELRRLLKKAGMDLD